MLKRVAIFILALVAPFYLYAWPRLGYGANVVTQNNGDKGIPFTVSVGTTTPVKVYTHDERDREILFENTNSTYYVYCGTHSAVNATSGPRFWIPPKPSSGYTNANYSIWCVVESGFGSGTLELLGIVERDSKDVLGPQ